MTRTILILPGDGIGPEIVAEAAKVLECLCQEHGLDVTLEYGWLGGGAVDELGAPYPEPTRQQAQRADAILLGAVGGPKWDALERPLRPESGLLAMRGELGLFANLRPVQHYPSLSAASALKPELVAGLDLLIVRELNGDVYFGQPRGIRTLANGEREGFNTMAYRESEVERIAHVAFKAARLRLITQGALTGHRAARRQKLTGAVGQQALIFVIKQVHGEFPYFTSGRPRTRLAITLSCTSDEPPEMVRAKLFNQPRVMACCCALNAVASQPSA